MEGFLKPTNQKFITIINRRVLKPTDPRFVYKHAWNGATSLLVKDSKIKKYYNLYKKRMHNSYKFKIYFYIDKSFIFYKFISFKLKNSRSIITHLHSKHDHISFVEFSLIQYHDNTFISHTTH